MTPFEAVTGRLLVAAGFRSRSVPTSVGRVHAWTWSGSGPLPTLVLFHGLGSTSLNWLPLLRPLRAQARGIVAIDLPGHGRSDPLPALTQDALRGGVIEALDVLHHEVLGGERAVIVGTSLGGAVALRYLNARPERAHGAVLFSPAGAPMSAEELDALREVFRIDGHADAVRFVNLLYPRPAGLRAHLLAPLLRRRLSDPALRAWLATVGPGDFLAADEVRSAARPIRVVWGRQERILPDSGRAFWRTHLPEHGAMVERDGMGHSPFLADTRWAADQVLEFSQYLSASVDRPAEPGDAR